MTPFHTAVWRVQDALHWAREQLSSTSEAALSSRMLLAHVLVCEHAALFAHPERALTDDEQERYRHLIARRIDHEPVAYVVGHRAFYDLNLIVDKRVLIPRPETERLVECTIAVARRWAQPRVADVGTGSGAIAISLARHLPQAQIVATDRSKRALQVAKQNAIKYEVSNRISFLHGDLLAPIPRRVHVIAANLPYVSQAEYADLPPDIRLYEPRTALVSGVDGLDAIRALFATALPYLTDDGTILAEIGATQGKAAAELAQRAFPGARITILPDDAGRDRIVHVEIGKDGHQADRL